MLQSQVVCVGSHACVLPVHITQQAAGCRLLLHWCTLTGDSYELFGCRRLSDRGAACRKSLLTIQAAPKMCAGAWDFP